MFQGRGMGGTYGFPDFRRNEAGAMGMGSSIPGLSQMLNAQGAGSPAASPGGIGPGNSMSPMDELRKHSDFATRFQRMGGSGPSSGGFGF